MVRPDAVLAALRGGEHDALIGVAESLEIEFKGQPFDLSDPKSKAELAKDVSAFCNADGGIIVIGVRTSSEGDRRVDVASEVRPVPRARIDPKQYEDVIAMGVYPPPEGVSIELHSVEGVEAVVASIRIPPQPVAGRPFLVVRDLSRKANRSGAWFGLYRRTPSSARPVTAQEVHTLIRDGEVTREILNRRQSVGGQDAGERPSRRSRPEPLTFLVETVLAAELAGLPTFGIVALGEPDVDFSAMLESRSNNLVRSIDRPPEIRSAGFDLSTGGRSELLSGRVRRSSEVGKIARDVWREGAVSVAVRADESFLCWASKHEGTRLVINPVALVEVVFLFCLWVHELFGLVDPRPERITWTVVFERMTLHGVPPALSRRPLSRYATLSPVAEAQAGSFRKAITTNGPFDPEALASDLLAEVYAWFGVESDNMPLQKTNGARRVVDVSALRNL